MKRVVGFLFLQILFMSFSGTPPVFADDLAQYQKGQFKQKGKSAVKKTGIKTSAEEELVIPKQNQKNEKLDPTQIQKQSEITTLPAEPADVAHPGATEFGLFWQRVSSTGRVPFIGQDYYDLSKTGGSHLFGLEVSRVLKNLSDVQKLGIAAGFGFSTQSFAVQSSKGFLIPDVRLTILLGEVRPYYENVFWKALGLSGVANLLVGVVGLSQSDQNNVSNWSGVRWMYGAGLGLKWTIRSCMYVKATYENRQYILGYEGVELNHNNFLLGLGVRW